METETWNAQILGLKCFNGATTFQPWRRNQGMILVVEGKFQWSQDFSAMETIHKIDKTQNLGLTKFQWGHDFSVMETWLTADVDLVLKYFNGATTFQSWRRRRFFDLYRYRKNCCFHEPPQLLLKTLESRPRIEGIFDMH